MADGLGKNLGIVFGISLVLGVGLLSTWFFVDGIQGSAVDSGERLESITFDQGISFPEGENKFNNYDWRDKESFESAKIGVYSFRVDDISKVDGELACRMDVSVYRGVNRIGGMSFIDRKNSFEKSVDADIPFEVSADLTAVIDDGHAFGSKNVFPDSLERCKTEKLATGFGSGFDAGLEYEYDIVWEDIEFNSSSSREGSRVDVRVDYRNNWQDLEVNHTVRLRGDGVNRSKSKLVEADLGQGSIIYRFAGVPSRVDVTVEGEGDIFWDSGDYVLENVALTEKWDRINSRHSMNYGCSDKGTPPCGEFEWDSTQDFEAKKRVVHTDPDEYERVDIGDLSHSSSLDATVEPEPEPPEDNESEGSTDVNESDGSEGIGMPDDREEETDVRERTFVDDVLVFLEKWFYRVVEF